jgi:hypothetical protein
MERALNAPLPHDGNAWRVAALTMMRPQQLDALLAANAQRALSWVRAAAEHGLAEAQVRLGRMMLAGEGTEKNEAEALIWFSRAAESGDAEAQNMLGRCFENGWGVEVDAARAAALYASAAEQSHAWAQYNLGHMLLDGNGVARDRDAAFACYMRASEQGHERAMNLLARCYEEGWGVGRDAVAARGWYRQSAERGYFRGQYNYASILESEGRIACALYWFGQALACAPEPTRSAMARALRQNRHPQLYALPDRIDAAAGLTEGLI